MNGGEVYIIYGSWLTDPHDKISLCIEHNFHWFFWFNSSQPISGVGVPAYAGEHSAITHNCFLDIGKVLTFPPSDLQTARARGPLADPLRARVIAALQKPILTITDAQRRQALSVI